MPRNVLVSVEQRKPTEIPGDAIAVAIFEGEKADSGLLGELDWAVGGGITRVLDVGEAKGKLHETVMLVPPGGLPSPRLLLVGAGKRGDFTPQRARTVAGAAVRACGRRGLKRVALYLRGELEPAVLAQAAAEGAILAGFDPAFYKTVPDTKREPVEAVAILVPEPERVAAARAGVQRGTAIAEAQNLTRTLVNMPGNLLRPPDLAKEARRLAELGLEVDVLEQAQLEALGAGGILAVSAGSDSPPALATLRYRGAGDAPFLALVGKGVTFDTGGISIKPSDRMHEMRTDMAGAAAVLGAMQAIARLKPAANVLGVIATVENMINGSAYRPGDVITSLSGKTIEVINTDAEGRIVLADAVTYAQRLGATRIVDVATLTGAVIVALGHTATGVLGAPQEWVDEVLAAADAAGEKMWQLPLFEEYRELLRSSLADVANSGGRPAGTSTGAQFVREFVADDVDWVHLDIAGTDSLDKDTPFMAKGPAGTAVRTFVELAEREASRSAESPGSRRA